MLCSLNFHFSTHTRSVLVARAVWGEKHVVDICSCQLECRSRVCLRMATRFMFPSTPGPLAGALEAAITSPVSRKCSLNESAREAFRLVSSGCVFLTPGNVHYTHQPDRNCYKFLNYIPLDTRKCPKCLVSRPVITLSHRRRCRRHRPIFSHSSNIPHRLAPKNACLFSSQKMLIDSH